MTLGLVNALPRAGRATQSERDLVWAQFAPAAGDDGRVLAKAGFDRCSVTTNGGLMSLRQCLSSLHDSLIGKLNTKYWKSLEAGS